MKPDWRQVIIYATVIIVEGCWLYALLALLNEKIAGGPAIPWLLLLYPVAFGCNRLLRKLRWPRFTLTIISWLAWAAAMLLLIKILLYGGTAWGDTTWLLSLPRALADLLYSFRPELLILAGSAVLWWLGRHLALITLNFAAVLGRFQFGLIILIITFYAASQMDVTLHEGVAVTLVFFLFALTGLSLTHAREGTGWLAGIYQGQWSGLLLVSIIVILLVGLLTGSIITTDLLQYVVDGLKWLWGLFMQLLSFFASLLPEPGPSDLPAPAVPTVDAADTETLNLFTMPEWLRRVLQSGWMILWAGLILLAIWRVSTDVFRWLRRKFPGKAGAQYEAMPGAFRADLINLLRRIVRRLLGLRLPFMKGKEPAAATPEAASVRELYRRFLHWAAAAGHARPATQTPLEYLGTLGALLPEARQDLAFITQEYISARYGLPAYNEGELSLLRESWRRLKQNDLKHISPGQGRVKEGDSHGQGA